LPFLLQYTVLQQTTSGIEVIMIPLDIHTTERHVEMGVADRVEHTHESTIITARRMLILNDEVEGLPLWQTTDSRGGMKCMEQVAEMMTIR
jgi:hypothetical protein